MENELFGKHCAKGLVAAYQNKYWQCQNPENAQVIFLGLDANWEKDIESNETGIYNDILKYLDDGVAYWKEVGFHHPFLLPNYNKGGGYKYHSNFAKTNISSKYADKVSFVELIGIPTYGRSSKSSSLFDKMIDLEYLKVLNNTIFDNKPKLLFIAKSVYDKIQKVKHKMKANDLFDFDMELGSNFCNRLMNIHSSNNTIVFVHTHFSGNIATNHLQDIGNMAISFMDHMKDNSWWKITFAKNGNNDQHEEVRYLCAKDVFCVIDIISRNIGEKSIKDYFNYLEIKVINDDEVDEHYMLE